VLISNAALTAAGSAACPSGAVCGGALLNPVFSPDGSTIAFDLNGYWGQDLWLANGDGSNPRQFPPNPNVDIKAGPPSWSGDGSQIAFAETGYPCGFGYGPCLSRGFPCSQTDCAGPAIMQILVSSGTTGQLNRPAGSPGEWPMDEHPAWSSDGRWLVFDRSGIPQGGITGEGIWRIRGDGTCLKRLAGDLSDTRDAPAHPVWRPGAGSPTDTCS
jgi:Tol biopolymer transport system component